MLSITDKILQRIKNKRRGWVFGPGDFLDIGSRAAVDQVLSRLVKRDVIRRQSRGIYDYPKHHPSFGLLSPDADSLARVIAAGDDISPSGAMAANMLGLSTQVPAKPTYVTNGPSRTRTIDGQIITLKHAKVPLLKDVPDSVNLLLQAFSYLGKSNMDDRIINHSASVLPNSDMSKLHKNMKRLPGWLADVVHKIEDAKKWTSSTN